MTEYETHVREVQAILSDAGVNVERKDIKQRFEAYRTKQVPPSTAKLSVAKGLLRDHGVDDPDGVVARHQTQAVDESNSEATPIADILEDHRGGRWYTIEAKFLQEFSSDSPKVAQTGVLADETDEIRFVAWASAFSDRPLTPGESYRLAGVVTNWWADAEKLELHLQSSTETQQLQKNVSVNERRGALVALQQGSGLIKRCPNDTCSRVLQNGRCPEHGPVDGELDLRIKGVLDTSGDTTTIYLNRSQTEQLTGLSFREARELAEKKIDLSVVRDEISERVVGEYLRVEGRRISTGLAVDTVRVLGEPTDDRIATITNRLEALS